MPKQRIQLAFYGCALIIISLAVYTTLKSSFFSSKESPFSAQVAQAGLAQNVSGWAWSGADITSDGVADGGAGWISFNSTDCDTDGDGFSDGAGACPAAGSPIASYGVHIDTGQLGFLWRITGFAWISELGWINFDPSDVSTAPQAPLIGATVDIGTGIVTGWARACAVFSVGCAGALLPNNERGGWDGWIKLGPGWTDSVTVDISTGAFSGYAWGNQSSGGTPYGLGWINFGPSGGFGGVVFNGEFNGAPVAVVDTMFANENINGVNVAPLYVDFNVLGNDWDPNDDLITISRIVTAPTQGTATILPGDTQIRYRPTLGYTGPDSLVYEITDGRGLYATAMVSIIVYNCGDNNQQLAETCDGNDLGSATCRSEAGNLYIGGDLTCTAVCTADTTQCKTFRQMEIRED